MNFDLHPNFDSKKHIADLNLCKILINNTADFPWIFLIPMRPNIRQIHDLSKTDQQLLMDEIDYCSKVMEKLFKTDQLNVAAIGNITPQLHVHIICRHKQDPYWPDVLWNKPVKNMDGSDLKERVTTLQKALNPVK